MNASTAMRELCASVGRWALASPRWPLFGAGFLVVAVVAAEVVLDVAYPSYWSTPAEYYAHMRVDALQEAWGAVAVVLATLLLLPSLLHMAAVVLARLSSAGLARQCAATRDWLAMGRITPAEHDELTHLLRQARDPTQRSEANIGRVLLLASGFLIVAAALAGFAYGSGISGNSPRAPCPDGPDSQCGLASFQANLWWHTGWATLGLGAALALLGLVAPAPAWEGRPSPRRQLAARLDSLAREASSRGPTNRPTVRPRQSA